MVYYNYKNNENNKNNKNTNALNHKSTIVTCDNHTDLSQERVLKSISKMKNMILIQYATCKIDRIECEMSPMVKTNMIKAYKRVCMFGKKIPSIVGFDAYGRQLPDKIDVNNGVNIKIVNPEIYGNDYLSFKIIVSKRQ